MQQSQSKQQVGGILGFIERIGNKIPDITIPVSYTHLTLPTIA